MNIKSITIALLSLSLAATAMGQSAQAPVRPRPPARPASQAPVQPIRPRPVPASPAVPAQGATDGEGAVATTTNAAPKVMTAPSPSPARPTRLPGISRPSIPTTAKSDDLVESPATNVVNGAFGYTLGAIFGEAIPDGATTNKEGEITFQVEPKSSLEPFSSVTLSISTNDHRIAEIKGETPRMALAESYVETSEKLDQIAQKLFSHFVIGVFVNCYTNHTGTRPLFGYVSSDIVSGKLYREYLTSHPNDPDFTLLKDITSYPLYRYTIRPVAGSYYNEKPVENPVSTIIRRPGIVGAKPPKPDYLQQIWQPFELTADYYPYAGDAVISFSVRDVEDRMEHTNLVSVADLKKAKEEEETKKAEESARKVERENAEQAFRDSLYRLSFAEAVEKAKANDPEALLRLAIAYADGKDVVANRAKAREYIEKACELKYGYAQYVYGLVYLDAWKWMNYYKMNTDIRFIAPDDDTKAAMYFEQAVSNGVFFAQEHLDYVRGKLKAQAEEKARKEKNAELLKGAMEEKSQEEETPADTYAEPETPPPQPARPGLSYAYRVRERKAQKNQNAPIRPARSVGDATTAPVRPATPTLQLARQATADETKETTANGNERDATSTRTVSEIKDAIRSMPFEEAAAKAKENDSDALVRISLAFAEGKELSKNLSESDKSLSAASEKGHGIAQYIQGLVAAANMYDKRTGFVQGGYYTERNARWRKRLLEIGWATDVMTRPDLRPSVNAWMWFIKHGVTEEQRLEREKELAEKAVSSFEKAVSNGVSIAQEDLDFMRKELVEVSKELDDYRAEEERRKKDKELSDELKRRNEELLKGNQGE